MQKITYETRVASNYLELKGDVFEEKLLIFEDDLLVYHARPA
jgi:hypothetical protein